MAIRHAEKPGPDGSVLGVDRTGRADPDELSVPGWQRAGALVPFFTSADVAARTGLRAPRALFAPLPTPEAPSVRSHSTLVPLAEALDLPIATLFPKTQEAALASAVSALELPVLVAWQHEGLCEFARQLVQGQVPTPARWPENRFDIVWLFERVRGEWRFRQIAQRLLAGDSDAAL